jgi:hypothetical protein
VSERRINQLLWSAAVLFGGGAVLLLALAFVTPLDSVALDGNPATRPASQGRASRAMPELADFEPIFAAVVRPMPADAILEPAVVADVAPAPSTAVPALTLVGTIGQSLAMLRNARGEVELKAVGDTAGDATVTSIQTSRVEMRQNGRAIVLEKPDERAPGS